MTPKAMRRRALREAIAACRKVYRDHKRSGSYPFDMGGLANECAAEIAKLAALDEKGTP